MRLLASLINSKFLLKNNCWFKILKYDRGGIWYILAKGYNQTEEWNSCEDNKKYVESQVISKGFFLDRNHYIWSILIEQISYFRRTLKEAWSWHKSDVSFLGVFFSLLYYIFSYTRKVEKKNWW